jgi:hypothetical protein
MVWDKVTMGKFVFDLNYFWMFLIIDMLCCSGRAIVHLICLLLVLTVSLFVIG